VQQSRGIPSAWLGHPVTVLALLVLVVNDHVLKAAYPGRLTGKLSDAAGLVLAPPLLAAVLRLRGRWVALVLIGAGFVLVKVWPPAAGAVSAVGSLVRPHSVVRADPTDLLTLPFLAVAWWTWQAAGKRPVAVRWVRAVRIAVLLPLALAGVAATSAPSYPSATHTVATPDGLYLGTTDLYRSHRTTSWVFTPDADRYERVDHTVQENLDRRYPAPSPQSCSTRDPDLCYRVLAGAIGVQMSTDGGGTWADSWRISDADRRRLARHYRAREIDPDRDVISTSVAVLDRPGGRHVVAVANGRDGFALRYADGTWVRVGTPIAAYGPTEVPELGAADPDDEVLNLVFPIVAIAAMVGLVLTAGGALAATRSAGTGSPWFVAPVLLLVGSALILAVAVQPDSLLAVPAIIAGPFVITIAALISGAAVTAHVVRRRPGRRGWALLLWAAGLLTAALGAVVWLVLWDGVAEPGTLRAVGVSLAACVPGLVLAGVASRRIRIVPPYGSGTSSPGWAGRVGN
jgi:hypothetical protein